MPFEHVGIEGVIADEVGSPRNDGTRGSALYRVPIRISRTLTSEEAAYLVQLWDRPPSFSTMHRPGIAQVRADRLVLDGTTIEEVRDHHAETLQHVIRAFNADFDALGARRESISERQTTQLNEHRQNVANVVGDIRFR